jgi:hypothetical protein
MFAKKSPNKERAAADEVEVARVCFLSRRELGGMRAGLRRSEV